MLSNGGEGGLIINSTPLAIYKTVLIIFPLNLQTITITLDVVKWRWGGSRFTRLCLLVGLELLNISVILSIIHITVTGCVWWNSENVMYITR